MMIAFLISDWQSIMPNNNNIKDPRDARPAANNNKTTQKCLEVAEGEKARRQLNKEDIETMENVNNSDPNYWEKEVTNDQEFQNEGAGESAYDDTKSVSITVLRFALKIGGIMEAIVNYLDDQHLDPWYETCKAFKFHDLNDG